MIRAKEWGCVTGNSSQILAAMRKELKSAAT